MQQIKHILVPVDFSPCSRAAVEQAVSLGRRFGAKVEVLYVWQLPPAGVPQVSIRSIDKPAQTLREWVQGEADRELDEFLEEFEYEGCELASKLAVGDPGQQILRAIVERPYDLVVMGTHGRTGLAHFFLGSLTERIVRHADCPVLTVRATRREARVTTAA